MEAMPLQDRIPDAAGAAIVHVVAMPGAPSPDAIVAELRAELRTVVAVGADALARSPVAGAIYLVWSPPNLAVETLERVVAWSSVAEPRPGLVACIPAGTVEDAESALAAGFDDAVVGPLSLREVAARVRAVHRRVHWTGVVRPGRLHHGGVILQVDSHELWVDGRVVALTSTEVAVVRALIRARGRILSRAEILEAAWHDDQFEVTDRAVDNVILRLRRKLPRPGVIQTVRGVGFRLGE